MEANSTVVWSSDQGWHNGGPALTHLVDGRLTINPKGQESMWLAERNEAAKAVRTPAGGPGAETITVAHRGFWARLTARIVEPMVLPGATERYRPNSGPKGPTGPIGPTGPTTGPIGGVR